MDIDTRKTHTPPIKSPNNALTPRNAPNVELKMVAICNNPRIIILSTIGHFLPYLSPANPNSAAPTDLRSNVSVIAVEIFVLLVP